MSMGCKSLVLCLCVHLQRDARIAALPGWYKRRNSQNAQKFLWRVPKVMWCLWAESPKTVSRTVQTLFNTGGDSPKQCFAPCSRLFWGSRPRGLETPFALSPSVFGHFGYFDTCIRVAGSQCTTTELRSMTSTYADLEKKGLCLCGGGGGQGMGKLCRLSSPWRGPHARVLENAFFGAPKEASAF